MSDSLRRAAREVVAEWARVPTVLRWKGAHAKIEALQRTLSVESDAADLSAAINARRQGDSVEKARQFQIKFWQLATEWRMAYRYGSDAEETLARQAALSLHLFGDSKA